MNKTEYVLKNIPYFFAFTCTLMVGVAFTTKFQMGMEGDSAIYFTYIKDFLVTPFLFGNKVKHGATGPLWVVINAYPYYYLGLEKWIRFAVYLNIVLVSSIPILISKSINNRNSYISILIASLLCACQPLFQAIVSLYELPLALFLITGSIFYITRNSPIKSLVLAGFSVLCRPELIIWAVSLCFLFALEKKNSKIKSLLLYLVLAISPAFLVYIYLGIATGTILPSSIAGRAITSWEVASLPWLVRLFEVFFSRILSPIITLSWASLLFAPVLERIGIIQPTRNQAIVLKSGLFLLIFFVIFPPIHWYLNRYLLILLPIGFFAFSIILESVSKFKILFLSLLVILGVAWSIVRMPIQPSEASSESIKRDFLLGKDLGGILNKLHNDYPKVLSYEIQMQLYTKTSLVSADGIVGGEFIDVLLKKQSLTNFILSEEITHVITMNAYKYRKIFIGTGLDLLYEHDLNSSIGDQFFFDNLVFTKIYSNPYFQNLKLYKISDNGFRVYGDESPWAGENLFWNSIYEVKVISRKN